MQSVRLRATGSVATLAALALSISPAAQAQQLPPDNAAALDTEATQGSSEPPDPACDVGACADFYHSFRQSDCTYQPYGGGPRQVCTKSGTQSAPSQPNLETVSSSSAMHGQCDFAACSQTYSSFNPSDCTYQPYGGGPRQLCEK